MLDVVRSRLHCPQAKPVLLREYGLRPLSHGRFTGIILTRNVAETVLLSQIQKRLREDNIDVDATIEAIYKSKNLKPPDKVKEATNFVTPLVDEIFLAMKPWTQVKNYGKNSEQDNQVAQRMQELEEEAAKYKQRLKSAGVEVTPTKVLPLQPPDVWLQKLCDEILVELLGLLLYMSRDSQRRWQAPQV